LVDGVCIVPVGPIGIMSGMGCGVISMRVGRGRAWILLLVLCGLRCERPRKEKGKDVNGLRVEVLHISALAWRWA
jgi:hypothetical protein